MFGKWQLRDHEAEQRVFNRRLLIAGLLVILLFFSLVLKLINLQVTQYEYFSARSDGNRLHSQYVPPARGLIFDRNGELLADNQPIFNLTVVNEQVDDLEKTLEFLSGLIRLTDDDVVPRDARPRGNEAVVIELGVVRVPHPGAALHHGRQQRGPQRDQPGQLDRGQ